MKPGVSEATTGVLLHDSTSCSARATTPLSVPSQGTISTSGSTGAGLKKCIPMTRSGRLHAAAIDATERDEVFVARIASDATAAESLAKSACLAANSSIMASITMPQPP